MEYNVSAVLCDKSLCGILISACVLILFIAYTLLMFQYGCQHDCVRLHKNVL